MAKTTTAAADSDKKAAPQTGTRFHQNRCGLVWCTVVWCGLVWFGLVAGLHSTTTATGQDIFISHAFFLNCFPGFLSMQTTRLNRN